MERIELELFLSIEPDLSQNNLPPTFNCTPVRGITDSSDRRRFADCFRLEGFFRLAMMGGNKKVF